MLKRLVLSIALITGLMLPAQAFYNGSFPADTPWSGTPTQGAVWVSANIPNYPAVIYQAVNLQPVAYTTTMKVLEVSAPATVARGSTVTVSYVIENTSDDNITAITAGLRFFLGTTANPVNEVPAQYVVTALPNPVAIASGTTANFSFLVTIGGAAALGSVVLDASSTGNANGIIITDHIWQDITSTWNTGAVTPAVWTVIDGARITVTSVEVPPTRTISTTATFNVTVNIANIGGVSANFDLPTFDDLQFFQGGNISALFSVIPPTAFTAGGLVLGAGVTDSLVYQVLCVSNSAPPMVTGRVTVAATVTATGDVVANFMSATGTSNFFLSTPPSLSISAITIVSPNGAVDGILSAGQDFVISVNVVNLGTTGITGPGVLQVLVPAGYSVAGGPTRSFTLGQTVTWSITATTTFLSQDTITVNFETLPLDVYNLVSAGVAVGTVTKAITVVRPAEINILSMTLATSNFRIAQPMSPPVTVSVVVQNTGSADATITVSVTDLTFTVSDNLSSTFVVTIPSTNVYLPGNGGTGTIIYYIAQAGIEVGAGTLNVTINARDINSGWVTTDAAMVTFNVTGNASIVVLPIWVDRNPIGYVQTFQVYVPLFNSSTASNAVTANVTPSSNDLYFELTAVPGTDLSVSFNIVPVSTAQFKLFPQQTVVVTYNVTPRTDALNGIYTINTRANWPVATDNASGLQLSVSNTGAATTNVIYDTISPNVVAVTLNMLNPPAGPTGPTTNFVVLIRYDESMLVSSTPTVSIQCNGAAPVIVGGAWSTDVSANDTFTFNPGTLLAGNEGWVTVSITGGGRDIAGNWQVPSPSIAVFYLDATPPTCAVTINNGEIVTVNPLVTLTIGGGDAISPTTALTMLIYGDVSTNPGILINTFIPYSQTVTLNLNTLVGTKNIYVVLRDAAGNISATANDSIFLDWQGAMFVSPSAGEVFGGIYNVKLNTTIFATTIYYYYIDPSGTTVSIYTDNLPTPPTPYNFNWNTALLPVGMQNTTNVSLYAEVWVSAAGVTYSAIVSNLTIDNIGPVVTVNLPVNPYIDGLTTFGGTATDNLAGVDVVEMQIIGGSLGTSTNTAAGTANWSYTLMIPAADPSGTNYAVRGRGRDRAGNWGSWSNWSPFLKDTSIPTVTITFPPEGSYVHHTITVTGTVTSLMDVSLVEISEDNGLSFNPATGTSNWSYTWNVPVFADGTPRYLIARAYNGTSPNYRVGTSNLRTVYTDYTSPNSVVVSLVSGDVVAGTVNVWGTAGDGVGAGVAYVDISFDNGLTWATANGTANWTYNDWVPAPAASPYTILTRAVDRSLMAGNVQSPPSAITVYYDPAALPTITILAPVTGTYVNNTMNVNGTAVAGGGTSILWVQLDYGDGRGWVTVNGTTPWTDVWIVPSVDPHGMTYNVTARAMNSKGILGVSTPAVTVVYIKDMYPPALGIIAPLPASVATGMVTIDIALSVSQAPLVSSSVGVLIDGVFVSANYISSSGLVSFWRYMWDASAAGSGTHTLVATARDNVNNIGLSTTVSVGTIGGFRTTVPIPPGNLINGNIAQPLPYATSVNVVLISGISSAGGVTVLVDGTSVPTTWVGLNLQVTVPATETDHAVNVLVTDPATGVTSANFYVICYDVTVPTINAWSGGINRLIPGTVLAPNAPFELNIIDLISSGVLAAGFGAVPTYGVFADDPQQGSILLSICPAGTTPDASSPNRMFNYNVSSEVLQTVLTSIPAGTYDLYMRVMDNAGNISATFNVNGIVINSGANGTSGKIDEDQPILCYPNPWDPYEYENVQFSYYLTDGVKKTRVYIYNEVAQLLHVIERDQGEEGTRPGFNAILWDGLDVDRRVISNGVYLFIVLTDGDEGDSKASRKFVVLRR